jgi:hypothetical protein
MLDVQSLRQNYDTRHGAIYYPWLTVPDPMPANLAALAQVPVPPPVRTQAPPEEQYQPLPQVFVPLP